MAAKRIVRLAILDPLYPIRSLEEYTSFGKSSVTNVHSLRDEVQNDLDQGNYGKMATPVTRPCQHRRFYTISEACLVALQCHVESVVLRRPKNGNDNDDNNKDFWMSLPELIPAIDGRLRPECPGRLTRRQDADHGAAHYLEPSTRSIEFLQITKLEGSYGNSATHFMKRHNKQGQVYFELLPAGPAMATTIATRSFPLPPDNVASIAVPNWRPWPKCKKSIEALHWALI
jgi:hypothetical protein